MSPELRQPAGSLRGEVRRRPEPFVRVKSESRSYQGMRFLPQSNRAIGHSGLVILVAGFLIFGVPALAQAATEKFCGGTAIEWANDVARSATDRLGNALSFGQPKATLDYSNDLFAISLLSLADRTGNIGLRDYGEDIVGSFVADDGRIKKAPEKGFRLDAMPAGLVLIDIYETTKEEKYRKAADYMRQRLAALPRTSEGTFAWAPGQIWLDGLWMTEPFYARYAKEFNEAADFDDILKQYRAVVEHSRDPKTGLYYHGWDERREQFSANPATGTSSSFWGRAMGWFAMSLVDTLKFGPKKSPAPRLPGASAERARTRPRKFSGPEVGSVVGGCRSGRAGRQLHRGVRVCHLRLHAGESDQSRLSERRLCASGAPRVRRTRPRQDRPRRSGAVEPDQYRKKCRAGSATHRMAARSASPEPSRLNPRRTRRLVRLLCRATDPRPITFTVLAPLFLREWRSTDCLRTAGRAPSQIEPVDRPRGAAFRGNSARCNAGRLARLEGLREIFPT